MDGGSETFDCTDGPLDSIEEKLEECTWGTLECTKEMLDDTDEPLDCTGEKMDFTSGALSDGEETWVEGFRRGFVSNRILVVTLAALLKSGVLVWGGVILPGIY